MKHFFNLEGLKKLWIIFNLVFLMSRTCSSLTITSAFFMTKLGLKQSSLILFQAKQEFRLFTQHERINTWTSFGWAIFKPPNFGSFHPNLKDQKFKMGATSSMLMVLLAGNFISAFEISNLGTVTTHWTTNTSQNKMGCCQRTPKTLVRLVGQTYFILWRYFPP